MRLVRVKWPVASISVLWRLDDDGEDNLLLHREMAQHRCWQMQTYGACTLKPQGGSS